MEFESNILDKSIDEQCFLLNIPRETIVAKCKLKPNYRFNWYCRYTNRWIYPEEYVLNTYLADGWAGVNSEGRFIHTILKLLSESRLSGYWTLDYFCIPNIQHYSKESLTHHQGRINAAYECICTSTEQDLIDRFEFSTNPTPRYNEYNRLQPIFIHASNWPIDLIIGAFRAIGKDTLIKMMEIMIKEGELLRFGWPDITVIKNGKIKFIEVKTTDRLSMNQLRVFEKILKPLNLDFSIAHLVSDAHE